MDVLGQSRQEGVGRKETRRTSLVFLMSFSFVMVIFSLYGANASVFDKARSTLLDFAAPVLNVLSKPVKWVDGRIGDVQDYVNVMEQNKQLREENDELRIWMNEALSLRRQVSYYERVYEMQPLPGAQFTDARVIGETNGPYTRAMILNAGRAQGVKAGNAVVNAEGMLGHIIEAGQGASRLLLLTDFNSSTPVVVEGADVEAILAGRFNNRPQLRFLERRDGVVLQPGMRVVTSGAGGVLPRGLPIGEVSRVTEKMITVDLYANYQSTDLVRVVNFDFPKDVTSEEEQAPEAAEGGDTNG